MKRSNSDSVLAPSRLGLLQLLLFAIFLYFLFTSFQIPLFFKTGLDSDSNESAKLLVINGKSSAELSISINELNAMPKFRKVSAFVFNETVLNSIDGKNEFSLLAKRAWIDGNKLWNDLESGKIKLNASNGIEKRSESCPNFVSLSASEFIEQKGVMLLPCGMEVGSHITVVGVPRRSHPPDDPKRSLLNDKGKPDMSFQFKVELLGLKVVDGEDPPRILHFNPRLKGDWSGMPVIEQNACYRMQWGKPQRCEGSVSKKYEHKVDGQVKCEKWTLNDKNQAGETNETWWLDKLFGRGKDALFDRPYPFAEGKLFVLNLRAGLEGFHIDVDGKHVTSFPYRTAFLLEDATGLSLSGDIEVHSTYAAALPSSHLSFAPERMLEKLPKWKSPPLPEGPVEIFIGVISAGNHFAERMAVRKSWMQSKSIKSLKIAAHFFIAMDGKNEVDLVLKKEAEYFGDIVIVPYMDHYDLLVLKTIAICEYGIHAVSAKYIMKCDDDTFINIDVLFEDLKNLSEQHVYIGNFNIKHKPLRHGKWAVTYEEWSEEIYPIYANGPGYIISSDIAEFITSELKKKNLRLFKMEDVSMGLWVQQFDNLTQVSYIHSLKFCQFGCIEDYYTAHYQSPRQMLCLWDKLQHPGRGRCCNK